MKSESICFHAKIERIAPDLPRFIVYSGKAWDETGTFLVNVSLDGVPIGLRNLIPWKERGWHFGLSQPVCRKLGVETGDSVRVEMRRIRKERPQELEELLKSNPEAQRAWDALPTSGRRDFMLFVAEAKKSETRMRRAMSLLGQ